MCFVNRATGERRDWCWPRQETLAKRLGVKKRQTVGDALRVLEDHGFIRREKSYRKRGGDALVQRGSDRYLVFFEVPLVSEDAVELLIQQTTPGERDGGGLSPSFVPTPAPAPVLLGSDMSAKRTYGSAPDMSAERTHREAPVDNSPDRSEERTYPAGRFSDSRTVTRTMTKNVTTVGSMSSKRKSTLATNPAVASMGGEERRRRGALAFEIGASLLTWTGRSDARQHMSEGFHRRIAFLLPETSVREALMATRDAVERQRSGQGGCEKGPSAYFADVVKKLAEAQGIDLGLRARPAPARPIAEPPRPAVPRSPSSSGNDEDNSPMDPQEAREAIRKLLASLGGG